MKFLLWDIYLNKAKLAKIHWYLYKFFKIKRNIPCGRNKKDKYLCCMLIPNKENSFITKNKHAVKCKVCDAVHMTSSMLIRQIDDAWNS